jgi:prepilin signal peptidase PulO-like enzyme (type II secretory pathway)
MSELNLKVFKGVLSASAGVLTNLFSLISTPRIVANAYIERADVTYEIDTIPSPIDKISMGFGILQLFTSYTYFYDEGIEDDNRKQKWLIYTVITLVIVKAVLVLYWQYGKNRRVKRVVANYILPIVGLGIAGFGLVKVLSKGDKRQGKDLIMAGLDILNAALGMWKFGPIKQSIVSDPVDGPVIIAILSASRMVVSGLKFTVIPYKGEKQAALA